MTINIQLLYDPNAPTEPNLWDRNFHPISLHSSMEHLALDSKSIKDSLNFIAKYISNKQVNFSISNNINTLRQKISAKFTLKVPFVTNKNNKVNDKPFLASIEKIPLFPPNYRRRLTKSPNISRTSNQPIYLNNPQNHMPRF